MEEQFSIDKNKLRSHILDFLKAHKDTAQWVSACEKGYTMDVPMMVVQAIMDFKMQEWIDMKLQIQNITEAIEKIHFSFDKEENQRKIEMTKYKFGLPSKYQPPTNFRFSDEGDDAIRNTIING